MTFLTAPGDLLQQTGFIIHGCNNRGIMGSGVAAGVKSRFPKAFEIYQAAHQFDQLELGSFTVHRENYLTWVVNAVTQTLGGPCPLSYEALKQCFDNVLDYMAVVEITEKLEIGTIPLNFPKIGAARGGGDWTVITAIINQSLADAAKTGVERPAFCWTVDVEPTDCR